MECFKELWEVGSRVRQMAGGESFAHQEIAEFVGSVGQRLMQDARNCKATQKAGAPDPDGDKPLLECDPANVYADYGMPVKSESGERQRDGHNQ